MSIALRLEKPPMVEDSTGAIRVGGSRVLLELVIHAFQDGASPESIVQRYDTLSLSDVYSTIGYFLRHQESVGAYLKQREEMAKAVRQSVMSQQPDMRLIRSRLIAKRESMARNAQIAD